MEKEIEIRSEEVQDILSRPPQWLIRWGITVLFVVIAGLFTGSYFFKYPDILNATIMVTTENLPAGVMAKTSGKIDTVFVVEKQLVKRGDKLACIENPARFQDVLELKEILPAFSSDSVSAFASLPVRTFSLGDLQPVYNSFIKSQEDYSRFLTADYHNKKIAGIKKQILIQEAIFQKSKTQLNLSRNQFESAKKVFSADSLLFAKKVIASVEYETSKSTFLQQQQNYENSKLAIDNQQISILQLEQSVFDLQQQQMEQENTFKLSFKAAYDQLSAQIKNWEQNYLLVAPVNGIVSFTKYWQKNQNINTGEVLVTIVPAEKTKIIGKIYLLPQGAGKVKTGQDVNVKFDNFPYMEYGMIRVKINQIALVPIENNSGKAYILEVEFPDKLTTNYGKTLTFSQEMTGTAEIITEDLRLIDRLIYPVKAVIKR